MDYARLFNEMHPGFFDQGYIREMPESHVFTELVMDLRKERPAVPAYRPPEGITFGVYRGSIAALREAVVQVDGDWVQYFHETTPVFCAFDGEAIAAFCVLSDWGVHNGLRIGGPGCVGTVPAYRGKGIGLEIFDCQPFHVVGGFFHFVKVSRHPQGGVLKHAGGMFHRLLLHELP
jgi:hypothetical protein